MSTEEQRAKWRELARLQRDRKKGLAPPPPAASGAPEFLTVETQETYVITGSDDCSIALTRDELEELYRWWKVKRKAH